MKQNNFSKIEIDSVQLGFIEREKDCSNEEYMQNAISIMGNNFFSLKQEHLNQIYILEDKQPNEFIIGDAIVTKLENLSIYVRSADCCPILIYCQEKKYIAAVHSGWKGAFGAIIQNVILQLINLGASSEEMLFYIGPTIRKESYEVSDDFFNVFIQKNSLYSKYFYKFSNYHFDLVGMVKNQISSIIKDEKQIFDCMIDTYCESSKYVSFRKNTHLSKDTTPRFISYIKKKTNK